MNRRKRKPPLSRIPPRPDWFTAGNVAHHLRSREILHTVRDASKVSKRVKRVKDKHPHISFRFLDLLGEIRNMIYSLALYCDYQDPIDIRAMLPCLVRTSRQLMTESIGIYYSNAFKDPTLYSYNAWTYGPFSTGGHFWSARWIKARHRQQTLQWVPNVYIRSPFGPRYPAASTFIRRITEDLQQEGISVRKNMLLGAKQDLFRPVV